MAVENISDVINLQEKMLPDQAGIERATWSPVGLSHQGQLQKWNLAHHCKAAERFTAQSLPACQ